MTLEVIGYWSTLEQDSLRVHTKDACLNHPERTCLWRLGSSVRSLSELPIVLLHLRVV